MKYSLLFTCLIFVILFGTEVTSLLSKTRLAPLSLLKSPTTTTTTTTTTQKPLLKATNTLTSSLSKLLGLGATTTTTTTPTPKTKISGAITDLKSIQSKLNELLATESLVAEEIDPTTTEAPLTIKPVLAVTITKPPILDEIKTSPVVTTDAKQSPVESSRADSVIQPVPCSEVKLQSEVNAAVQTIGLMTDKKPSVESTTELPQTTVSVSDITTTSPPIPVNTANVSPVVIVDDYAKQTVELPQADSKIQPVPSTEVQQQPLLNVAVQNIELLMDEKQSVESTTQPAHTTESLLDMTTTAPTISDNTAKISPAVITDDYAKENLLEQQTDNGIHPAPPTYVTFEPSELNVESTIELPHTIIDTTTTSPHISENAAAISPEIATDDDAKQISVRSSKADNVIQPGPSTELDLKPEVNILSQSTEPTGLTNDEKQSIEATIEIPPTTVSVSDMTTTSPPTSGDTDNISPPVETTDDNEKQISQSGNDVQPAQCAEVEVKPSELSVSLQNIELLKDEKENVEVEQLTDPSELKGETEDAEEIDQVHLGDNSQDELSMPVTFDQTEVEVPLTDEPQLPSIGKDSTLMNESTDPVIYPTKIQVAEHSDPSEQDELSLPAFPKVTDAELPEHIITGEPTDSLLPEVESETPFAIPSYPDSIPSESPDIESAISSRLTEENADVNPSPIPSEESVTAEHNNLPSQEDPSTNQPEDEVPVGDTSNTIQLETGDEQSLLSNIAPLTPTEPDTQSTILNDVHSPNPAAEGMNIFPTITCATLRVNSMPEATPPISSPESTVVNYSGLSEKYSPYLNYGNAALQYQTYRLPITASIDNSVMGFNNWFNYRNKPLIDIHDNEINLMEIVIG